MKILAWIVLALAFAPLAVLVGVMLACHGLYRWAQLTALYGGDRAKRDRAEWRLS